MFSRLSAILCVLFTVCTQISGIILFKITYFDNLCNLLTFYLFVALVIFFYIYYIYTTAYKDLLFINQYFLDKRDNNNTQSPTIVAIAIDDIKHKPSRNYYVYDKLNSFICIQFQSISKKMNILNAFKNRKFHFCIYINIFILILCYSLAYFNGGVLLSKFFIPIQIVFILLFEIINNSFYRLPLKHPDGLKFLYSSKKLAYIIHKDYLPEFHEKFNIQICDSFKTQYVNDFVYYYNK